MFISLGEKRGRLTAMLKQNMLMIKPFSKNKLYTHICQIKIMSGKQNARGGWGGDSCHAFY